MPEFDVSLMMIVVMFLAALLAGWVDTLAGGGGLITIPAMLLMGMSPVAALATNKAQGFVGTLTATVVMVLKGRLKLQELWGLIITAAIGSMFGSWVIQQVQTTWLGWLIPILLLLVAVYFLLTPKLGKSETSAKMSEITYGITAVPAIGFYDGALGPGTGSFFAASGIILRGQTLLQATIRAKLFNFVTNISAMLLFAVGGKVVWIVAGVMMLGQLCGALIASHTMLNGGEKLIRPLVITMCCLMSASQLYKLLFS